MGKECCGLFHSRICLHAGEGHCFLQDLLGTPLPSRLSPAFSGGDMAHLLQKGALLRWFWKGAVLHASSVSFPQRSNFLQSFDYLPQKKDIYLSGQKDRIIKVPQIVLKYSFSQNTDGLDQPTIPLSAFTFCSFDDTAISWHSETWTVCFCDVILKLLVLTHTLGVSLPCFRAPGFHSSTGL